MLGYNTGYKAVQPYDRKPLVTIKMNLSWEVRWKTLLETQACRSPFGDPPQWCGSGLVTDTLQVCQPPTHAHTPTHKHSHIDTDKQQQQQQQQQRHTCEETTCSGTACDAAVARPGFSTLPCSVNHPRNAGEEEEEDARKAGPAQPQQPQP